MAVLLRHKAVVTDIDAKGTATVEVARSSACSACGEKSSCSMTDGTEIRLKFRNSAHLKAGDVVEIAIEKRSFYKSLAAVYVLPLIIMLITALLADSITSNQLITAASTLVSLVIYFLILYIRNRGKEKQSYRLIS